MSRREEFQLGTVTNRELIDLGIHYQNRATQFALTRGGNLSAEKYAKISVNYFNTKNNMQPKKAEKAQGKMQPYLTQMGTSPN